MTTFKFMIVAITAVALLTTPALVRAQRNEDVKLDQASNVLKEIMGSPDRGIPESMLRNAYGVAVFPGLLKAGFIVGMRYGKGVLVVRNPGGEWSNPLFVSLGGGSFGWQIGAQSTDIILVFKTQRSVDAITRGKFTLGADVSVAAGPVGRHAEADTDIVLRSEILSYSRSRGLFAGVALDGAVIQVDRGANATFYRRSNVTPREILAGRGEATHGAAKRYTCTVAQYTLTGKCA
jgi:lipid-binding SYLF domain-containing protein